ncbi:MAG: AmmeMemoRadiSam system protein B [Bacteroidales bacterium]
MKTRDAVMEGRFYPSTKKRIFEQFREMEMAGKYEVPPIEPVRIFGAVLPHAGHVYSGYQTIPFFQLLKNHQYFPETFVIVHPNHTGLGPGTAVAEADVWKNSIGEVPVDREFALALELPFDRLAHAREHSAEVIVPYLQYYMRPESFSILPVCLMDQSYGNASEVARKIERAVTVTGRRVMILASCDFSHFLSPEEVMRRDQYVLDAIHSGKPEGVESAVKTHQASVCGYGPIMVLMEYAKGAQGDYRVEILASGHSGEVYPSSEVVHYISMILYQ